MGQRKKAKPTKIFPIFWEVAPRQTIELYRGRKNRETNLATHTMGQRRQQTQMRQKAKANGKRIARLELLGIKLRIVEDNGCLHLLAIEPGLGPKPLATVPMSRRECTALLHSGVDVMCKILDACLGTAGDDVADHRLTDALGELRTCYRFVGPFRLGAWSPGPIKPEEIN